MAFALDGHVAFVTGSSRGLGKDVALTLGRAGAKVAFNYLHNQARAEATFDAFKAAGGTGLLIRGDASDEATVNDMCAQIASELGTIDILVPNATPDQPQMPIEEFTWQHCQDMIDFFIKSPFLLTKACLAGMKEKKWGRIVNITSEVYHRSVGNFVAYVSAKGGQTGFTRSMASELAPVWNHGQLGGTGLDTDRTACG